MSWTDDRVETLKRLWPQNMSASQIAERLGGVTRNAVLGKVHRLGLPQRECDMAYQGKSDGGCGRKGGKTRRVTSQPRPRSSPSAIVFGRGPDLPPDAPIVETFEEVYVPPDQRKGLLDLADNDCRWPIGDTGTPEFHFCNGKKFHGLPYCERHARVAFQPPSVKGRAAAKTSAPIVHRETEDA